MSRFQWLATLTALFLALGAVPALAEEGAGGAPTDSPLATLLLESGLTAAEIEFLIGEGLGFAQIFLLKTIADSGDFGSVLDVAAAAKDPTTGEYLITWGLLMNAFDGHLGRLVSGHKSQKGGNSG